MNFYLLDTDHISLFQAGHPRVIRQVVLHSTHRLAISVITVYELLNGWQIALNQARDDSRRETLYQRMALAAESFGAWKILPYPLSAMARHADLLRQRLNVGSNDLKIAAIAFDSGAIVVTRNRRDFSRVPGLLTEDWSM